jgi:hypothetical protein
VNQCAISWANGVGFPIVGLSAHGWCGNKRNVKCVKMLGLGGEFVQITPCIKVALQGVLAVCG